MKRPGEDKTVCPNCGQWQHAENGGDCLNECRRRGFAPGLDPECSVCRQRHPNDDRHPCE